MLQPRLPSHGLHRRCSSLRVQCAVHSGSACGRGAGGLGSMAFASPKPLPAGPCSERHNFTQNNLWFAQRLRRAWGLGQTIAITLWRLARLQRNASGTGASKPQHKQRCEHGTAGAHAILDQQTGASGHNSGAKANAQCPNAHHPNVDRLVIIWIRSNANGPLHGHPRYPTCPALCGSHRSSLEHTPCQVLTLDSRAPFHRDPLASGMSPHAPTHPLFIQQ